MRVRPFPVPGCDEGYRLAKSGKKCSDLTCCRHNGEPIEEKDHSIGFCPSCPYVFSVNPTEPWALSLSNANSKGFVNFFTFNLNFVI